MQKFPGCKEDKCNTNGCTDCLNYFPKNGNNCTKNKDIGIPTFKLFGFDKFKRDKKRLTFNIYLRIIVGMMDNVKIKFKLNFVKRRTSRFLSDEEGDGIQIGTAEGTYSDSTLLSNYLAKFECNYENAEENYSYVQIKDIHLTQVNDKPTDKTIDLSYVSNVIYNCSHTGIEDDYKIPKTFYPFLEKSGSNTRRLNKGTLNMEGTVDTKKKIDNEYFSLKTTDENIKEVGCYLNKEEGRNATATLKCSVDNLQSCIKLNETINGPNKDSSYMSYDSDGQKNEICAVESNSNSGTSYSSKSSSSSGGLSGGAVAGIVIGGIAVVAIIGTIIFFVSKGTSLFGGVNAASAAYTEAATSSVSNVNVPKLNK